MLNNHAKVIKIRTMSKKHDIMWFNSVDSTNDEAKRRISDIDNLSVLSSFSQTAGRGQGNHTWLSAPGENLLFSIVLKFREGELHAKDAPEISRATADSLVEFLEGYGIEAWIKPPNDIYVGGRKICGTLIENSIKESWIRHSIIGIGLNINERNFNVNLPNPTSMVLETKKEAYDIHACLEEFMIIFSEKLSNRALQPLQQQDHLI